MAIYGRDFYGLTKYGAAPHVDFEIDPFVANPRGYNTILISWKTPAGTWDDVALVRSRVGYPSGVNDGELVPVGAASSYTDHNLVSGAFYYYSLFISKDGVWTRAGVTSALSIGDVGLFDVLWNRIPRYYRFIRRDNSAITDQYYFNAEVVDRNAYDQENQHLRRFIEVLAWGFNYVGNYSRTLMWANDPKQVHMRDLERLANQLGVPFEHEVPPGVMRNRVANAALLARRRGNLEGIRDLVTDTIGFDVDLNMGDNLFLSIDQAEFANPQFPEWQPGTNYETGALVEYIGRVMRAKTGGAYGSAQSPPVSPAITNTYWDVVAAEEFTSYQLGPDSVNVRAADGTISTWAALHYDTTAIDFVDPSATSLALASGITSPFDSTTAASNSLKLKGDVSGTHDYMLLALTPNTNLTNTLTNDPGAYVPGIGSGIPLPRATPWREDTRYTVGEVVFHAGMTWKARMTSFDRSPLQYPSLWDRVGHDERARVSYSAYVKGTPATDNGVVAGLAFYDERGQYITRWDSKGTHKGLVFSFNDALDPFAPDVCTTPTVGGEETMAIYAG